MIVAVCCPGPSLPRRWIGRGGYAVVYAVNRALILVSNADWLCAADHQFYVDLIPDGCRPRVGVLTGDNVVNAVRWGDDIEVRGWGSLSQTNEHEWAGRPMTWSVQSALCLAADHGATQIDLYGCDGAAGGTRIDCTGYAGENRGPDRWAREEIDLALTIRLLAERNVSVNRIAP